MDTMGMDSIMQSFDHTSHSMNDTFIPMELDCNFDFAMTDEMLLPFTDFDLFATDPGCNLSTAHDPSTVYHYLPYPAIHNIQTTSRPRKTSSRQRRNSLSDYLNYAYEAPSIPILPTSLKEKADNSKRCSTVNLNESNPVKFRKKFGRKNSRAEETVDTVTSETSQLTATTTVRQPLKTITNTISDKNVLAKTPMKGVRNNDFILKKLCETITKINDNKHVNLPMDDLPVCTEKSETVLLPNPSPPALQSLLPATPLTVDNFDDYSEYDATLLETMATHRVNMWTRENELVLPPRGQTCNRCGMLFRNGKDLVLHIKNDHKI